MFKKKLLSVLVLLTFLFSMGGCAQKENVVYNKYNSSFFGTFDTVVTVIGFAPTEEAFKKHFNEVQKIFEFDHKVFDKYNAYDGVENLYALNLKAGEAPVKVHDELFDLLTWCKTRQTEGLFSSVNIAMGAVFNVWHDYRDQGIENPQNAHLPTLDELQIAHLSSDIEKVVLNEKDKTVFFTDPLLQLDLGAVAKGYTAERAAQYLLKSDMKSFIISAGGNVRAGNMPLDGRKKWGVGIQDPDSDVLNTSALMDTLFLTDLSVVTSGDYQRYYEVDGVRYHHLISPQTLMPANFFRSVTVVAENSMYADFLSTELFLLPYEEGLELVKSLKGVEALWVFNDRTVHMTEGMKPYAHSMGATSK